MSDTAYAFTIYFATLGPLKTIPAFFLATDGADRPRVVALAVRSATLATAIVLFVALVASGTMVTWRVSPDAMAVAGGLLLLMSSIKSLTGFQLQDAPVASAGAVTGALDLRWMGRPVLAPLTIPSIVTPIGVVAVLYFSGLALGQPGLQAQLAGLLLAIMALNLVAMLCAGPIMRVVGLPVLQVFGWVFAALQAGLGVEAVISAVRRLALAACLIASLHNVAAAQELEPRAYGPAPTGTIIGLASIGGSRGSILLDPSVDVADVEADLTIVTTGFGYTFALSGRQARVLAVIPIASGYISGDVGARPERQDLHGMTDPRIKLSIGLRGMPARTAAQMAQTRKRAAVNAALTVMPPVGQYKASQLLNLGYHRWAFKPEVGVFHTIGRWTVDGAAGMWLFTVNDAYFPGRRRKSQNALASMQGHVSYALTRRSWVAGDATWFAGGKSHVDGVASPDRQRNVRLGATLSLPIWKMQSLKFSYSSGTLTRRGTDFDSFAVTWQLVKY